MGVLKLKKHDEKKEIEFELDYLLSLTTKQRFELMFKKSRQMARLLKKNWGRKTVVVKRSLSACRNRKKTATINNIP